MQEKLFNFLTIRHVHKSLGRPRKPAIFVNTGQVQNMVTAQPIADRVAYFSSQWAIYKQRGMSWYPKVWEMTKRFRTAKLAISPTDLAAMVLDIYGKDLAYVMANSTYKGQHVGLRILFSIWTLANAEGAPLVMRDSIRVIEAMTRVNNGSIKTTSEIVGLWDTRIVLHEDVPEFMAEKQRFGRAVPKTPDAPLDKKAAVAKLRGELEEVEAALEDTKTKHVHEVLPYIEIEEQGTKIDQSKLLKPNLQIRYSASKIEKMSSKTKSIISKGGYDVEKLEVRELRNDLKTQKTNIISKMSQFAEPVVVKKVLVNGQFVNLNLLQIDPLIYDLDFKHPHTNKYVKPLGIGELKTVEQVNMYYEAGEIAHVENILLGEHKVREHNRETFSEKTVDTESYRSESTENELATTQRHELSSETSKVIEEQFKADFNIKTNSDFGPWLEVKTDSSFGWADSEEKSSSVSSNFAKETVEKAVKKIQESVREQTVTKTSRKINELNRHELNNIGGTGHVTGVYRWLNKKYDARVRNHGFRTMYEFTVPEPAAFHIFAETSHLDSQYVFEEPLPPTVDSEDYTDQLTGLPKQIPLYSGGINENNYLQLGSRYKVQGMTPPPIEEIVLMQAVSEDITASPSPKPVKFDLPGGYLPFQVLGAGIVSSNGEKKSPSITVSIGKENVYATGLNYDSQTDSYRNIFKLVGNPDFNSLDESNGRVEAKTFEGSMMTYHMSSISMSLLLRCKRTNETYKEWQLETYEQIMAGYHEMKAEYDEKVRGHQFSQGIVIGGNNPLDNKMIVETEFKKHCMSFMMQSPLEGYSNIYANPVLMENDLTLNFPEINLDGTLASSDAIQFLENAFDWKRMMFQLFPYYWSDKRNWISKRAQSSSDPEFQAFLRAGAARVVLAVREGFEEAVAYFMSTGFIPTASNNVGFANNLHIDLVDLLKEEQDKSMGNIVDQWKVTLPTNLVILDDPDAIAQISRVFDAAEEVVEEEEV